MRKFKLEDPLHPDGGPTIQVKHDHDCVFCSKCIDIMWDYTHLIYSINCAEDHDVTTRPCEYFTEREDNYDEDEELVESLLSDFEGTLERIDKQNN